MPAPLPAQDTRWVDAIALALFAVVVCASAAAIVAPHFIGIDLLAWIPKPLPGRALSGYLLAFLAATVWLFNTLRHVVSPLLHRIRHGTRDTFRGPSGLPGVGTLLVGLAALLLPPSQLTGALLGGLFLSDTGGLPWALAVMGWDGMRKVMRRRP